jgi:hypothetical protein
MADKVFCTEPWIMRMARKEADRDVLKLSERVGELAAFLVITLIGIYFIALQVEGTGFFAPSFSAFDMALFYGALFYGLVPSLTRAATGRRNLARPLDVAGSVLFIISGSYFLTHWAFDFSHFADILPQSLQFVLSWVTNEIAQGMILLGLAIALVLTAWTSAQYYFVRQELQARMLVKAGVAKSSDSR